MNMFSHIFFKINLKEVLIRVRPSVNWVALYFERQNSCCDEKYGNDCMFQTSHCYGNIIYSNKLQDISFKEKYN